MRFTAFNGAKASNIKQNMATAWAKAYRGQEPGEVQSHFFGRDISDDRLEFYV